MIPRILDITLFFCKSLYKYENKSFHKDKLLKAIIKRFDITKEEQKILNGGDIKPRYEYRTRKSFEDYLIPFGFAIRIAESTYKITPLLRDFMVFNKGRMLYNNTLKREFEKYRRFNLHKYPKDDPYRQKYGDIILNTTIIDLTKSYRIQKGNSKLKSEQDYSIFVDPYILNMSSTEFEHLSLTALRGSWTILKNCDIVYIKPAGTGLNADGIFKIKGVSETLTFLVEAKHKGNPENTVPNGNINEFGFKILMNELKINKGYIVTNGKFTKGEIDFFIESGIFEKIEFINGKLLKKIMYLCKIGIKIINGVEYFDHKYFKKKKYKIQSVLI